MNECILGKSQRIGTCDFMRLLNIKKGNGEKSTSDFVWFGIREADNGEKQ
jgi:hypothetical protein